MDNGFVQIGSSHAGIGGENSFWPSFTDVMMVITLIFLMATSILVVRNWQLVAELQESVASERMAAMLIESTSQENSTLEERLANAEQSNSILRLRLLKKDEQLAEAQIRMSEQDANLATLQSQNAEQDEALAQTQAQLDAASLEISTATAQVSDLERQIALLNEQLAQQQQSRDEAQAQLQSARSEMAALADTSSQQQQKIDQLSAEKNQLALEIDAYNQQLLTLKGEYETVKSQYEELIKPARSARGKVIAEVYYVKGSSGAVIRYRQPGDEDFSRLSLTEVETRLAKLKAEHGENLYVKIIIPDNSGLSYNEAWEFMRKLLVKYDYYYQN